MLRKLLFILLLLPGAIICNGQSESLNKLQAMLLNSTDDANRIDILIGVAQKYYFKGEQKEATDSMLYFLNEAYGINETLHSEKWQTRINCYYSKYYLLKGQPSKSSDYIKKIEVAIGAKTDPLVQAHDWEALAAIIYNADTLGITRIYCFEKAITYYQVAKNIEGELEYARNIADEHMKQGKLNLAEAELLNVLDRYKKIGYKKLHYTYQLLSVTNTYKGNFNIALNYALLAIENMKQSNDMGSARRYYSSIAYLYHDLGQLDKSIEYFSLSMQQGLKNQAKFYDYRDAGILASDMIKSNKPKEALTMILGFSSTHPPLDTLSKASLYQTLAYCYQVLHNNTVSAKYYEQLIRLAPFLNSDNEIRQEVEYDIAGYFFRNKQFGEAAKHLAISRAEAVNQNSAKKLRDINLLYFKIDSAEGKYISAIDYLNQYRFLNDSLFNETKSKQIEEVQAKYESEKKEQNIMILQKENLVQQNNLKQAVVTRNFVLASIVLLLFITVLLYSRYRIKRNANENLTASQREIERQNNSLKHLVKEKEWLLKEIHHRVKNNLHTIIGLLDAQSSFLKSEEAIVAVSDSQHRVQAMSMIHQKLFQSEGLSTVEMSPYIYELVSYLEHSLRMPQNIKFKIDVDNCVFRLSHALPIGLILNEAITNSLKYAFPKGTDGLISVFLKTMPGDIYRLVIMDDGIGLPSDFDSKKSNSMGMSLMQGLSEDLQGQFVLKSNGGTYLEISFVYEPE